MKKPKKTGNPDIIYLQQSEEGMWSDEGVTWCRDKINDSDAKYISEESVQQIIDALDNVYDVFPRMLLDYEHEDFVDGLEYEKCFNLIRKALKNYK